MPYTIPAQSLFRLAAHELAVQLDTGEYVAVRVEGSVEPNSGNPVVSASARVVDATGSAVCDALGQPITSGFSHCSNPTELASLGGSEALQRLAGMAVLGESTAPLWADPIHSTVLENASIRTNIASAAHAGPVTNLAALL